MRNLYRCVNYEELKDGEMILAFGCHVFRWDLDLMGEPAYGFVPVEDETDQLRAENERLREAVGLLRNWVKAYPLDMFPEPDLKLARKLLEDGGVNYSALNVYSMRHVINGVGRIIEKALKEVTK